MLKRFLPYSAAIAVAFLPGLLRADIDSSAGLSTCFLTALGACNYNTSGPKAPRFWERSVLTSPVQRWQLQTLIVRGSPTIPSPRALLSPPRRSGSGL